MEALTHLTHAAGPILPTLILAVLVATWKDLNGRPARPTRQESR